MKLQARSSTKRVGDGELGIYTRKGAAGLSSQTIKSTAGGDGQEANAHPYSSQCALIRVAPVSSKWNCTLNLNSWLQ